MPCPSPGDVPVYNAMTTLTPDAKSHLSTTIRALRDRLLRDLRAAAEAEFRLAVPASSAGLAEAQGIRRARLDQWLDERVRAADAKSEQAREEARDRFLNLAVKEAAATLLNRLVLIRHMEAVELVKPAVVTGGWNSKAYREFRDFAPDLLGDDSEGYAFLLQLLFDELALDLPGLFGEVGISILFKIPTSTLREIIEQLDDPRLESAWTDDTTLGWVYQYWNDPEREAIDKKINSGGKVAPHEIASKTQMFTERYMVEWLLHNSLGLTWLAMCKKHEWTPDAEVVLDDLDQRRAQWRVKREAGEVALDALMPINEGLEERWKYYVPQPIPDDAVKAAPETIREIKLLDPACGSGHFLIIAFDLLVALYREEARHRGESWSDREIAESIVENNVYGVDIDPRAIQIAAAGIYLKARRLNPEAKIRRLNLVAPALNLANLLDDDPALKRLLRDMREEAGIPEELTQQLVGALAGVDHLGTLLKVDVAVEEAIRAYEKAAGAEYGQGNLFGEAQPKLSFDETRATVLEKLESFLSKHRGEEDLGLRLDGEQLAAGLRFVRIVREGAYDIVVGNPPYQGTSKMVDAKYVARHYPRGKADLYAAFLERGLQLCRDGGMSALLTMRGWMFISQFTAVREHLLQTFDLVLLSDLGPGAFEEISAAQVVVSVDMSVFQKTPPRPLTRIALRPTPPEDTASTGHTDRKRAGLLAQVGRYDFDPRGFEVIEGEPIVYWWGEDLRNLYRDYPLVKQVSPARAAQSTSNNPRFLRYPTEIHRVDVPLTEPDLPNDLHGVKYCDVAWVPCINGSRGRCWIEPVSWAIRWDSHGLQIRLLKQHVGQGSGTLASEENFFRRGLTFVHIGSTFGALVHRAPGIFTNMGSSVFPNDIPGTLCLMNSAVSRFVLQSLNPGVHFEVGDVNRLPIFPVASSDEIYATLDRAFTEHEAARENSVEFHRPGPTPWRYAQDWAQRSVDRPEGAPLPPYEPEYDPPTPGSFVSFAAGIALGRFGAIGSTSEGILDPSKPEHRTLIDSALPHGILFLSATTETDSLDHPACALLHETWRDHGPAINAKTDLRTYLRLKFFEYHRKLYKNRPIYFPLSSAKKTFVAWISIHRWSSDTLQTLLADHLMPERRRLDGELEDLRKSRAEGNTSNATEKRFDQLKKALTELEDFITSVTTINDKGPPTTDATCPPREADARFEMDLDDGVMVNSAALWPLFAPQWPKPKSWWKELAAPKGKKDYDWSHLAAHYFPTRVDAKCRQDPSLGVAHGCFWRYHPAKAYQWELRLQDEIRPDFTIDEEHSDEARTQFLNDHPEEAAGILTKETKRREKKRKKAEKGTGTISGPLFDGAESR